MDFDRIVAVLTGDIVDSSGLQRVDQRPVSVLIENAADQLRHNFQSAIHSQIDIFRGDSWQLIVLAPTIAFRIGLYFRALLRAEYGIDSRVSIGYGLYDFLPGENISTGTGQAFTLSGQGLEACRKPTRMVLSFPAENQSLDSLGLKVITQLVDLQAGRWTPGQSRAVAGALLNLTQAEIAANWKPESISQQAISQHLDNAGWIQINHALGYLETSLPEILD